MSNNRCILPQLYKLFKRQKSKVGLATWLIIFGLTFAWRIQNLDAFGLFNDEGVYLMWARLALDGYPLYSETQAVQPPLFFEVIGWAFQLAGRTIQTGRWTILISFSLLAIVLSWLAHRAGGWAATMTAVLLLGIAPLFFTFSRLTMAEAPAAGLAILSLALFFLFIDRGHKGWLFISGLALGLSLIIKALNPFLAVPIGLLLLMHHIQPGQDNLWSYDWWPAVLFDGALWGVGVIIPLGVTFLIYEPVDFYNQVIAFRSDLRAAIPGSWSETWDHFALFINSHWGFWLLAFGGIISAVLRTLSQKGRKEVASGGSRGGKDNFSSPLHRFATCPSFYPAVWVVWLVAGMALLAWHTPLFEQHFVVLLPPLILLGAGFIADVAALWQNNESTGQMRLSTNEQSGIATLTDSKFSLIASIHRFAYSYGPAAALSLIILGAVFNLPSIAEANQNTATIVTGGREAEALELLRAISNQNDFLMGDSQLLIFMADRRTPPPMGDVALVAIKAGRQTSTKMINLTDEYQAPAVVQWSLRLPWLPDYLAWVEENYLARRVWDSDHIIYFVQRFPDTRTIPNERLARLGGSLALRGYQIDTNSVGAGRDLSLTVYWQTDTPLTYNYTIFTQLLDSSGSLVTGWDSQPLGGYFPTPQWPIGEIITDKVSLPLPPNLPAGNYTLITGMYHLETLERLQTPEGIDHIILTTIKLE